MTNDRVQYYWAIRVGDRLHLFDPTRYTPDMLRRVHGRDAFVGQVCYDVLPIIDANGLRPELAELVYGRNGKPYIVSGKRVVLDPPGKFRIPRSDHEADAAIADRLGVPVASVLWHRAHGTLAAWAHEIIRFDEAVINYREWLENAE